MKKIYNKLVRDRIPEVIEQAGKKAQIQQVNSLGLHRYALDKLREEVEEFVENPCAEEAADILEKHGVSIEVIDPRTISPFNDEVIINSVKRTGHCIVVDNDWLNCGFSAEVAARVSEFCFKDLKSPVYRIGFAPTPCPTTRPLENEFYPNAIDIIKSIERILKLKEIDLSNEDFYSYENQFKGPF